MRCRSVALKFSHLKASIEVDERYEGVHSEGGLSESVKLKELHGSGSIKGGGDDLDSNEFVSKASLSVGTIICHDVFTPLCQDRLVYYLEL